MKKIKIVILSTIILGICLFFGVKKFIKPKDEKQSLNTEFSSNAIINVGKKNYECEFSRNSGKTKLLGEQNAAKAGKYYILRTAWLYGLGGKNFVKTMLKLSENHDTLNVVCDQHGSPTSTTTLCEIIEQVIEKEPEYGVYHSTNEGFTTWYDFTKKIFELANKSTVVNPVTSEQYKEMNPASSDRPKNSQLSKHKLESIGIVPSNWEDALANYLKEELK